MRLTRLIALVSMLLLFVPSFLAIDTLPRTLSDDAFWRMVSDFSEESGSFRSEYMSNEREFQFVIPRLKEMTKPGGVYLGVGPEQNFTYIAAIQPKIAFIFDIRRGNMLEHLMYKAIFEMSPNRADFVSRLFSRKPASGLNDQSTATALFQAFRASEPDSQLFKQNLQAIKEHLTRAHSFKLTADDQAAIDDVYETLFRVGPGISYPGGGFGGFGGFGGGASYAGLMAATDERGQARSYLATEENFRFVREMERNNVIVPVVGDFAGPKALRTVAKYLKDHDATVTAFYTSNVEQYLFQQGDDWRHFLSNVATFPLDSSSTFIRSPHFSYDRAVQLPSRQLSGGNFISLLCPMKDLVTAFNAGRIQGYEQVIRMSR